MWKPSAMSDPEPEPGASNPSDTIVPMSEPLNRSPSLEGHREAAMSAGPWWCFASCSNPTISKPAEDDIVVGRREEQELPIVAAEVGKGPLGKAKRTAATMALGTRVHVSTRWLRRQLDKETDLDEQEKKERWDELHKKNAKLMMDFIFQYRGLFIKVGQKASTMKGILPDPFIEAFEPLQDCLPVTGFDDVRTIVHDEFGRQLEELFESFEAKPIASASIGQAHVATLRATSEKVCVKVQHPGVAELAGIDLDNLEIILRALAKLDDDVPDTSELLQEIKNRMLLEVDFKFESENAKKALEALNKSDLNVGCVEPLMEYCSTKVMTMQFIDGWKITETERLPASVDRESLASSIVEAWALLCFRHGLIHGDPHPGNVFVEHTPDGGVRPVLLDWGMAKRLTPEQQVLLAKLVVASLSRDRFMYIDVLSQFGMVIRDSAEYKALDVFAFLGLFRLRDTVPASSMQQFTENFAKMGEQRREAEKKKQEKDRGKKMRKLVDKMPGDIELFVRALDLLQDVCGMLEVSVPVAKIMLKYALPQLGCTTGLARQLSLQVGSAASSRRMETAIQIKLDELGTSNVLAAQVAVLADATDDRPSKWLCDLAAGRLSNADAPISTSSLLPLLDVGVGVLATCLVRRLAKPTVTGKQVTLDTPVERLWPEFSRGGKAGTTIRQLLLHEGGLQRPFKHDTTYKAMLNEQQMEKTVAAAVRAASGPSSACRVLGIAIGALLRRATGHQTAAEAVGSVLAPVGLAEDITYQGAPDRSASVGRLLLQEVSMAHAWEFMEAMEADQKREGRKLPPWITWRELGEESPWCVDPRLVNCPELRDGKGAVVGRGLRASGRALCQLYASGAMPEQMRQESGKGRRTLSVESLDEWRELGCCLEVFAGWQLFKFRRIDSGEVVYGHGHADGATGSVALHVPGASIAVLLTCADKDASHVGRELVSVVAKELGLEPLWYSEVPDVPEQPLAVDNTADPGALALQSIARVEAQVARLTSALEAGRPLASGAPAGAAAGLKGDLAGSWKSAETQGFENLLDAMHAPAMAKALVTRIRMQLTIEGSGDELRVATQVGIGSRTLDHQENGFRVGEPFEGKQFGGKAFKGSAKWAEADQSLPGAGNHALVTTKRFTVERLGGAEMVLEEMMQTISNGARLVVQTCIKGKGRMKVAVDSKRDLDALGRIVDQKTGRLTGEIALGGTYLHRGGEVVEANGAEASTFAEIASRGLPCEVVVQYSDKKTTVVFDRVGQKPQPQPQAWAASKSIEPQASESSGARRRRPGCVRGAIHCVLRPVGRMFLSLGRALEGACA